MWYEAYIGSIHYYDLYQLSDERLKKNIVPYKNSIDKIKQINVIKYDLDESAFKNTKAERKEKLLNKEQNKVGFSAQQLRQLFPGLVEEGQDSVLRVNYVGLIPILTAALQEQQQLIEQLTEELEKLKIKK